VSIEIPAADLEVCLRVLAEADELPPEHPDAVAIRRATARIYKGVKESRRSQRREKVLANDRAVTALTATGARDRIDDETQGLKLVSNATGALAGRLLQPRSCYTCKSRYVDVDAFYHQLCPPCALLNRSKRDERTDLTGRRALLTGGRAKIGMYIALRLLRDGAHTTITTRFPSDAVRRFTAMEDSADWIHRLRIVGIDLRDPAQVVALADSVAAQGPLDILINNAAQTVRRSAGSYAPLVEAESTPLPIGPLPEMITFDHVSDAHPSSLAGALHAHPTAHATAAHSLTGLALRAGSASPARVQAGTAIDAFFTVGGYPAGTVNRHTVNGEDDLDRGQWEGVSNDILAMPSPVNVGVESSFNDATRELTVHVVAYYTAASATGVDHLSVLVKENDIIGYQADYTNGTQQNSGCVTYATTPTTSESRAAGLLLSRRRRPSRTPS